MTNWPHPEGVHGNKRKGRRAFPRRSDLTSAVSFEAPDKTNGQTRRRWTAGTLLAALLVVLLVARGWLPRHWLHPQPAPLSARVHVPGTDVPYPRSPSAPPDPFDAHAMAAPPSVERSFSTLVPYLVQGAGGDRQKARAIFTWIASRVAYDIDGMRRGICEQHPQEVLAGRVTDCVGFARLFVRMAVAAGLKAEIVDGCYKALEGRHLGRPAAGIPAAYGLWYTHHVWNAVRIDGHWSLVDCCFGSHRRKAGGQVTGDSSPVMDHFLPDPSLFIYTHLPYQVRWQLLAKPVRPTDHPLLPILWSPFFDSGLQLEHGQHALIPCGSHLDLRVIAPDDVDVTGLIAPMDKIDSLTRLDSKRAGDRVVLSGDLPGRGRYLLYLYAAHGVQADEEVAAEFLVVSKPPAVRPSR